MNRQIRLAATIPAVAIVTGALTAASSGPILSGYSTTPPGVTLVEVTRELTLSQPDYLWTRPGDAKGRTLFISDKDAPGVANCVAECAAEFPPLAASRGAKPFGDWSLVKRADGTVQWAYQSHPLYTWTKEKEAGEVAVNVGITEAAGAKIAERKIPAGSLMPADGWTVVRFTPAATLSLPAGINAGLVNAAEGVTLTDFNGMTLYAYDGDAARDDQTCSDRGCKLRWSPVTAGDLSLPVGDFSVVTRADGTAQWAYRKKPLYRYAGDLMPGDILGVGIDKKWKLAVLAENYNPAHVAVRYLEGYGPSLTVNGMTLYGGYAAQKRWGGRNTRNGFRNGWSKGKRLGVQACGDDQCLAEWHPFLAPPDAQSQGFWEVYDRPDGTKQWAYKGYALWTHAGDKKPGDMTGQMTYTYAKLGGSDTDLKRMKMLDDIGGDFAFGGAGIYWTLARP